MYRQNISGKPLEALELFWIGQMMKAAGKGYNAKQFFEAAASNKYDLSPRQQQELSDQL